MMDPTAAAWAAGVLDGEGCIDAPRGNPRIRVKMSDPDVIIRIAHLMDARYHSDATSHRRHAAGDNIKPLWIAQVTGARAAAFLRDVLPHLSARRTVTATNVLLAYDARMTTPALRLVRAA